MLQKILYIIVFSGLISFSVQASEKENNEKIDPGVIILEHVQDAHSFHFFSTSAIHAEIPLPVILYSQPKGWECFSFARFKENPHYNGYAVEHKNNVEKIVAVNADGSVDKTIKVYDFSLTRNVVQLFIVSFILIFILIAVAKQYTRRQDKAPSGFQNAIEMIIIYIRDEVIVSAIGKKKAHRYMPLLLTMFFFILINNLVGLIPSVANVTGNIAFTMPLALISFAVIEASSNKHYWREILWPKGIPLLVKIIVIPIEISGIFTKPFALMIRLFANIFAGHMVILCFILIIFIFGAMNQYIGYGFAPISVAFVVFMYFLELLVAFLQAYIFTSLSAVFIAGAMPTHDEH